MESHLKNIETINDSFYCKRAEVEKNHKVTMFDMTTQRDFDLKNENKKMSITKKKQELLQKFLRSGSCELSEKNDERGLRASTPVDERGLSMSSPVNEERFFRLMQQRDDK